LAFIHLEGETASPLLVSAGSDARLRVWSVASTSLLFVLPHSPPPGVYASPAHPITSLLWSARAAVLLVGDSAGRVGMWDGSKLRPLLASAGGGAVATAREKVYHALTPRLRWRAHDAAVASLAIVSGDWHALVRGTGLGGHDGDATADGGSGAAANAVAAAPSASLLEEVLRQTAGGGGDGAADDPAAVSVGAAGSPAVGGEVLMTAARDGSVRLWTMGGAHIGTFSHDTWKVGLGGSYAPPPRCWQEESPACWEHPPHAGVEAARRAARGPMLRTAGGSTSFLTSVETEEEESGGGGATAHAAADDSAAVRASVSSLLQHASRRRAERLAGQEALGETTLATVASDNEEAHRESVLLEGATNGLHTALSSAQLNAAQGELAFGLRPSSSALRQATSAPVLPHLRTIRAPALDDEAQHKRADERARAHLTRKFREYQAQFDGALGGDATLSTDLYFRQRDEARARPKPARPMLAVHELGDVQRRRLAKKGERLERLSLKF